MSPRIELQLDRVIYEPGETISGAVTVLEGGDSRSLETVLEYKEETADFVEVAISIPSGPLHEGDLTTGVWPGAIRDWAPRNTRGRDIGVDIINTHQFYLRHFAVHARVQLAHAPATDHRNGNC